MEYLRAIHSCMVIEDILHIRNLPSADGIKYLFSRMRTKIANAIPKTEAKTLKKAKYKKILRDAYFHSFNFEFAALVCFDAMTICPQDTDEGRKLYFTLIERRAQIFFKMRELKLALRDVEFLKTSNYCQPIDSNFLNQLVRMVKCKIAYTNIPEVNRHTEELSWASTNKIYPALTSKVKVDKNEKEGRFVIATENIKMGEIIGVERPYAWATDNTEHCNHCLLKLPALFVCHKCPVLYCSAECFEKAKFYHQYECGFIIEYNFLVVLRMISQRSLQKVIDDEWIAKEERKDEVYKSDDYYNVTRLMQHYGLGPRLEEGCCILHALFLLSVLRAKNYFTSQGCKSKPDKLSKKEIFVARLLLRYLNIVKYNSLEIDGTALYPTFSLINHGCDRPVIWYSIGNLCILRTIQPIKAGQRITINYIGRKTYRTATKTERNDVLFKCYKFICNCRACIEDWPRSLGTYNLETYRIKCKCGAFILHTGLSGASSGRCSKCKKLIQIGVAMKKLREICSTFAIVVELVQSSEFEAGKKLIIETIEIAFQYFELPNAVIRSLQDLVYSLY